MGDYEDFKEYVRNWPHKIVCHDFRHTQAVMMELFDEYEETKKRE